MIHSLRLRTWMIVLALLAIVTAPAQAQETPAITFGDPAPLILRWPEPIEITVLNNTTENLLVDVQMTPFTDRETDRTLPINQVMLPLPPSMTIPPAGQASLRLPMQQGAEPAPGRYTGALVLSVASRSAVIRKPITLFVPAVTPSDAATVPLVPLVDAWTLNAVRVLPFLNPICVRGLLTGCTIPAVGSGVTPDQAEMVEYVTNDRGGGMTVSVAGYDPRRDAQLNLAFDRPWGLVGSYTGEVVLTPPYAVAGPVNLRVNVKDVIVWPLLTLVLGVWTARRVQHFLTVHRTTLKLLRRLDKTGAQFGQIDKSIYGYTIAESFEAHQRRLRRRIRAWDGTHYGEPTEQEEQILVESIIAPLTELERQITAWATFRTKLDRLRHRLEEKAEPAIEDARPPSFVTLEEEKPIFYTRAKELLNGRELDVLQVTAYAERIDKAAELAATWAELHRLARLVGEALWELHAAPVSLSKREQRMVDTARHRLNSAIRDLWEAPDLEALQARETRADLAAAREIAHQLIDPVIYAGMETTTRLPPRRMSEAGGEEDEVLTGFPAAMVEGMAPLARSYAHIESYAVPRLNFDTYESLPSDTERIAYVQRTLLLGERTIAWIALTLALIAGLETYFTTNFGTLADYLVLFTWGLTAKVALELLNVIVSRLLALRRPLT